MADSMADPVAFILFLWMVTLILGYKVYVEPFLEEFKEKYLRFGKQYK